AIFRDDARSGEIEILYKRTGRGTALLSEALPGQRVAIVGPLGSAFRDPAPGERVAIVAGGTGIASVYALAARLRGSHRVELLFGARSAGELMAIADFEALGVELAIATDDGSRGARGLVTTRLERALAARVREPLRVYACGPNAMLRRCAELTAQHDVPCEVALENHMACGFGVCLGCAAPLAAGGYALVCRDGPAFDAAAIDWGRLP
ncbi:MAG TPA: dihydroorotate dehydrogenase electron transfer subunit, partial [Myxococcota bacterium]|nr:dihydroorotate dehydrogenase electron transfer subunit [Myxococcota bacterium]